MMNFFKSDLAREYCEDKFAVLGLVIFLILCCFALVPSLFSPQDPYDLAQLFLKNSFLPPGEHFFTWH